MVLKNELACNNPKGECGVCGIPNPMNTHTKGQARLGFAITLSPSFQKGIVGKFGIKEGKEKIKCEYERVKRILESTYGVFPKAEFQFKVKPK